MAIKRGSDNGGPMILIAVLADENGLMIKDTDEVDIYFYQGKAL